MVCFATTGDQFCCIGDGGTTWPPAWRAATRQGELQPWPQELEPLSSGAARRPPAAGMLQPLSGVLEPRCSGAARGGGEILIFWDDATVDRWSEIDAGTSLTERRRRCSPELRWSPPAVLELPIKDAGNARRKSCNHSTATGARWRRRPTRTSAAPRAASEHGRRRDKRGVVAGQRGEEAGGLGSCREEEDKRTGGEGRNRAV